MIERLQDAGKTVVVLSERPAESRGAAGDRPSTAPVALARAGHCRPVARDFAASAVARLKPPSESCGW
jgi:hypothetical protein